MKHEYRIQYRYIFDSGNEKIDQVDYRSDIPITKEGINDVESELQLELQEQHNMNIFLLNIIGWSKYE